MKKVVYILTLAVAMTMAACNTANESSASKSSNASGENVEASASVTNNEVSTEVASQEADMSTLNAAVQPNGNQANLATPKQEPKAPFSAEDAVKYKEGIKVVKEYGDEVNKCVDAKLNGKVIDEATKQRIAEIQKKLNELEKAGKLNQQLLELKMVSDDVYNKVKVK
ncbi:MAG: hypothetical protein IK100_02495 [Muribaculaceae bacterium]|nr:hypothetical protein [Muribaculaceae bacterium]